MRLKEQEKEKILSIIHQKDPTARVYLFGSRVDDEALGGDVDVLVISPIIGERERYRLRWDLIEAFDEQNVDLAISKDGKEPFIRLILEKAVALC